MAPAAAPPPWREFPSTPAPHGTDDEAELVIVGAGPVGLTLALDLGLRGRRVVVLNRLTSIPAGSKAICFSKHSLEIFDRLGVGQQLVDAGVTWETGKVFWGATPVPVYEFDLLPLKHQKRPAFINLQQYRVEEQLIEALAQLPNVELRWGHEAIGIDAAPDRVSLAVSTDSGEYRLRSPWVVASDGFRSPVRRMLGLDFDGRAFDDRFLIADVHMDEDRPAERWFWFDPPFNPGGTALLHRQPDRLWRLDFQLDRSLDSEEALEPANIDRWVRGMLGPDMAFEAVWTSVYKFQCRRMNRFVHGHVIFAGDAAHVLSPFGARGCNGGIADSANLGWKLDLVLRGQADSDLIESYNEEAIIAADENIRHSTRSTEFIGPKTEMARAFRNAVLELARDHEEMRSWVNSGRLSTAVHLGLTSLTTPDSDVWDSGVAPGSPAIDAPYGVGWLLDILPEGFVLLARQWQGKVVPGCTIVDVDQVEGDPATLVDRYDLKAGSAYLLRPDRYVAARWRAPDPQIVACAIARARTGHERGNPPEPQQPQSSDEKFEQLLNAHAGLDPDKIARLDCRNILLQAARTGKIVVPR